MYLKSILDFYNSDKTSISGLSVCCIFMYVCIYIRIYGIVDYKHPVFTFILVLPILYRIDYLLLQVGIETVDDECYTFYMYEKYKIFSYTERWIT